MHPSTHPATGRAGPTTSSRKRYRSHAEMGARSRQRPSSPRAEVRATQSVNPQPRRDPTRESHRTRVGYLANKKTRRPNWNSKWPTRGPRRPTSYGGKRPRWRHCESRAPEGSQPPVEPTPAARMTSRKKKDISFLDKAREGRQGDTKRRWRRGDKDRALSR